MNITTINNTNPSFNGKIITKGNWPKALIEKFNSNPEVIKLASGKNDIIANMSRKFADKHDLNHFQGEEIYKLTVKSMPENATVFDKIKSWFTSPVKITRSYHSASSMESLIETRMKADRLARKLNIEI